MSDRRLVEGQRAFEQVLAKMQEDIRALQKRSKLAGTGKEVGNPIDPLDYTSGDPEIELTATTVERGRWLFIGRVDWRTRHDTTVNAFTGLESIQVRIISHPLDNPATSVTHDITSWSPHVTEISPAPGGTSYVMQPFSLSGLALLEDRRRVRLLGLAIGGGAMQWHRIKLICVPL